MRNALPFHVSLVGRTNLSREIYQQTKAAIVDGRLGPGHRLSPTRELARALAVSRMTVTVAYEWLTGEGLIESRHGVGTFVAESMARRRNPVPALPSAMKPRRIWQSIRLPVSFERPVRFDFRVGLPDTALFPHRRWQHSVIRALTADEPRLGRYEDPIGHRRLRELVAEQISFSRGIRTAAANLVVTNGTQQSLDVLARTLLDPGETIAVEDPGYSPAIDLFNSLGLQVAAVPVDGEGLVVAALPRVARVVYVTPSHQFPMTVTMSLRRRQALLAWAQRRNAAIIEDDYDSEFRFGGRPCEPLHSMDPGGRVIYVGSFSKTLLPSLRVGFLVAPTGLLPALQRAKFVSDWHTATLSQSAIADFVVCGGYARHLRRMTGIYRKRRELIQRTIAREFAEHLEMIPSNIGLHLAALAPGASAEDILKLSARAAERQVAVQCLSRFAVGPKLRVGIMLGYGAIPTDRIEEGLRILHSCF